MDRVEASRAGTPLAVPARSNAVQNTFRDRQLRGILEEAGMPAALLQHFADWLH